MKKIITLLLLIACACGAKAQIITTVAGGGTGGLGDGGLAVDCELLSPYGIVLDNVGNLYIADRDHNLIRKVGTDGAITTIAGNGGAAFSGDGGLATNASIDRPIGITFDAVGNLYFSDHYNSRIRKIDATGIITTFAGNGIIGDTGDGGPATAAEFNGPGFLKFDRSGNLFISDAFNNRIRMINTAGIISTIAGTGSGTSSGDGGPATAAVLNYPCGIALDIDGNVYFTEYEGNRIRKINAAGIITTISGNDTAGFRGDSGSAIDAELNHPDDIEIDTYGNLYIADQGNQRVREISTSGIITTIAGNGMLGYSGDTGDATMAEFRYPTGIVMDNSGSLYISDQNNERIRYIRNTVGVSTLNSIQDKVLVYPNPSDGQFTILISSKTNNEVSISITDQLGRTIVKDLSAKANEVVQVNENILPGMYFLSVKDGEHLVETTKLLIK